MGQTILWIVFATVVVVMLVLDLGVFHRRAHVVSVREALGWSGIWIGLALLFNLAIYFLLGTEKALLFLAGYLTEESLSIDNLFVFYVIFGYFGIPSVYQHRVLFWGIVGAMVMRGIFIALGLTIIERFHWSVYIFGAFLIFTGIRLATGKELKFRPERNPLVRLARRFIPFTSELHGSKFFIRGKGRRVATLLLFVLLVVEATDILFAIDSVPAVVAITQDPFIVYSSNMFAILGLRALYFALAGIINRLRYLNYGLSVILAFLGVKMIIGDIYRIPAPVALGVIGGVLTISVIASLLRGRKKNTGSGAGLTGV